jgi:hypothetical protein
VSTRGGRVELKLGLKETYRTMLLQLKIQNAFLGGKREDEQGLARSDFEALVREHRAQCEYICDEPDIPEFVEVCASALCLKRWDTRTCAPRLCTSGDHRCVCACVRVCVFRQRAWCDARRGSTNTAPYLHREAFSKWYVGFLAFIEKCKRVAQQMEAEGCDTSASCSLYSSPFTGDDMWTTPMATLQDALEASWAKGRTPLLIDATADGGDSTPLETYYAYSGDKVLDMKRAVVEVDVRKEKTLEQALSALRIKLCLSMRRGYHAVFMLGNAAPKLRSRFSSPTQLPFVLLSDNSQVSRVLGREGGEDWRSVEWTSNLLTEDDCISVVHRDFQVVAVTRFPAEEYEALLGRELPLRTMQHIRVTKT